MIIHRKVSCMDWTLSFQFQFCINKQVKINDKNERRFGVVMTPIFFKFKMNHFELENGVMATGTETSFVFIVHFHLLMNYETFS